MVGMFIFIVKIVDNVLIKVVIEFIDRLIFFRMISIIIFIVKIKI